MAHPPRRVDWRRAAGVVVILGGGIAGAVLVWIVLVVAITGLDA